MALPRGAVLICLLYLLGAFPVGAAPDPVASPSPGRYDDRSFPAEPPDPQPPAPEEHAEPIPVVDPFKLPTDGGTLVLFISQALEAAMLHNTDLQVAETQRKEAYWAFRQAGALPSAQLSFNHLGGTNSNATATGLPTDNYVTLTESFGPLGNIEVGRRAAYQGYQKAKANLAQVRNTVVQNVKDAFYTLLVAQEQLHVAQETLDLANSILKAAQKRFDAGKGPRMDLVSAGIQQSAAQQGLITAVGALKQAQDALNPLLGAPAHAPVEAAGAAELPTLKLVYDRLMELASQNPKIQVALRDLEQNRTLVKLQRVQNFPTPSLFFNYDFTVQMYTVGAGLTFPIDFGQNHNAVRQQLETVHEKEQTLNGALLSVSSALKTAYDSYLAAAENAATFQEKVLAPSEELVKITRLGFEHGALPYLNLLTAQQNLKAVRAQYLGLLLTGRQALDALEAATDTALDGEKP